MRIKENIVIQYSIVIFFVMVVFSSVLGLVFARRTKNHLVGMHVGFFPKMIKQAVGNRTQVYDFFSQAQPANEASPPPKALEGFIDQLLSYSSIFRLKFWGADARVLWANTDQIIGQRFPENTEYRRAWNGEITYTVGKPDKPEQQSEKKHNRIFEIYTPIVKSGEVIGVIEIYQEPATLFRDIDKQVKGIWVTTFSGTLLLYLLLLSVFVTSEKKLRRTAKSLTLTREAIIYALIYQTGLRDFETGKHLQRTAQSVELLATELRKNPHLKKYIDEKYIYDLVQAAPLHDIGKVGIPDVILNKKGLLTQKERSMMEKHCEYGEKVLKKASERLPFESFLSIAIKLVSSHHERWDGDGYPRKLKGEGIPLSGRIMAVADTYDALRSARPYKKAFSHKKAVEIIKEEGGAQFDPQVVAAFIRVEDKFRNLFIESSDE